MSIKADVIARVDERASRAAADQLVREWAIAGKAAGDAFNRSASMSMAASSSAAVDKFSDAVDKFAATLPSRMTQHGTRAGESFGTAFGSQMARSLPGVSGFASAMAGYEGAAGKMGAVAGRALGMAFTTAAGGLLGAAAYTMFKGFERYEAIDAATHRLQNLSRTMEASGRAGLDVAAIMRTVNSVVEGTPIALNQAMTAVTTALGSGIQPGDQLKRYLTDIADAAGYSGRSFDELALVFGQVQAKGRLMGEETLQFMEKGIPVAAWMKETFKLTGDEYEKLQEKGQISLLALQKAIEQHAGGQAKAMGETIQGSITNLQTSVARTGANVLGAMFGKPTETSNQLVDVLKTLKQRMDEVGAWVSSHQNDIRDFFKTAAEVGKDVVTVMGHIATFLSQHKQLAEDVVVAYAGWKAIEGIASVATGLSKISTLLRGIPADAALAKTAMAEMGATGAGAGAAGAAGAGAAAGGASRMGALARMLGPIGAAIGAYELGKAQDQYQRDNPGSVDPNSPFGQWINSQQGQKSLHDLGVLPGGGGRKPAGGGELPFDSAPVPGDGLHWEPGKGWVLDKGLNPDYLALPGMDRYESKGPAAPDGNPFLPPRKTGGDHLPKAPVVPYDTSLPPGFDNLPMSASLFGAESGFMDARFKLAEKQARLNQLEHDNNATAQEILDARNDVITAGRDQQQAELRLYEARQEIFDKQNKQFKDWRNQLGEIGASLDQDFGISKGLAGIVENITKMLANLAAAPVIGALKGLQIGMGQEPGAAGSGIAGMLAAGGAFGPTLQGDSRLNRGSGARGGAGGGGIPGVSGAGGGGGGPYPGDAALLSHVPGGRYEQTAAADLTKGIGDCSSAVEDLVNILDGRSTAGRSMSTANEAEWLTAHGFLPGMGGPGDFRVGFNSGHTQATLPGGTPFNWGSNDAAARGGVGGTGADDPALTSHYYRPGGGGGGMPAGAPAGGVPGISLGGGAPATPAAPAAPGGATPGQVGPGSATTWRTNADGSKTGLDANGNATGDYVPAPMPGRPSGPSTAPGGGGVPGITLPSPSPSPGGVGSKGWKPSGGAPAGPPAPLGPHPTGPGVMAPGTNALDPGSFVPGQPGAPGAPVPGGGTGPGLGPFGRGGPPAAGGPGAGSWIGSGSGLGFPSPGGGPEVGPTLIGGAAPPAGMGGGFTGAGGGGLIGLPIAAAQSAISAAGMGADAMGGGGGASAGAAVANAAIQIGVQEINRAIGFGAQAAGIGVSGLMETFLPMGASEMAQNSWVTRIVGGIVGARPALPNLAGGGSTKEGLTPEQAAQKQAGKKPTPEDVANPNGDPNGPKTPGAQGDQAGTTINNNDNTTNVTVNNQRATEDGTGKDLTYALGQQYTQPGQG